MLYNTGMSVQLYMRTSYSIGYSSIRIEAAAAKAARYGYDTMAITDRGLMCGVPVFQEACRKYHVRPVIGLEVSADFEGDHIPFVLLAKDQQGYRNLLRLSSLLCMADSAAPAVCTMEQLRQASGHCLLIAPSDCGAAYAALIEQDEAGVIESYARLKDSLGDFIIGISGCEKAEWRACTPLLHEAAAALGLSTCAFPRPMYEDKEDEKLFDIVNAIRQDAVCTDMFLEKDSGCWLMTPAEVKQFYDEQDIRRSEALGAQCTDYAMPRVGLPVGYHDDKGNTSETYLSALAQVGLQKRMEQFHIPAERKGMYEKRLQEELQVINSMHFADYFLIVFDYVRYAKRHDIWTGPGRGSAVASLTAYAIGITDIDPLAYNLLFARFLNTGRRGMPDIDVDFAERGRGRVIQYVKEKYGESRTAGVVTVSYYKTKNLLKAVGQAMDLAPSRSFKELYEAVRRIYAKRDNEGKSLHEIRPQIERYLRDPAMAACYDACEKLAGIPSQYGRHPSGIVVADQDIVNAEPLMRMEEEEGTVYYGQFEEKYLEERGLIKMDFLSLPSSRPLEEMIRAVKQQDPSFDIHHIDMREPALYDTFRLGLTMGYFQFDARSMKNNILPVIQPADFNDLMVCNAIGRANLSQLVQRYAYLKQHPSQAVYYSEELKPVLAETYGIMLYQEQVILTAHVAADYTMAEADALRRGIKKKDEKALQANSRAFIDRCMHHKAHPYAYQEAVSLWQDILRFASYGFNKSHSAAYTTIAVWEAYMKIHHTDLYYDCLQQYGSIRYDEAAVRREKQMIAEIRKKRGMR